VKRTTAAWIDFSSSRVHRPLGGTTSQEKETEPAIREMRSRGESPITRLLCVSTSSVRVPLGVFSSLTSNFSFSFSFSTFPEVEVVVVVVGGGGGGVVVVVVVVAVVVAVVEEEEEEEEEEGIFLEEAGGERIA